MKIFNLCLGLLFVTISSNSWACELDLTRPQVKSQLDRFSEIVKKSLNEMPLLKDHSVTVASIGNISAVATSDNSSFYLEIEGIVLSNGVKVTVSGYDYYSKKVPWYSGAELKIATGVYVPVLTVNPVYVGATYDEFGRLLVPSHCRVAFNSSTWVSVVKNADTNTMLGKIILPRNLLNALEGKL